MVSGWSRSRRIWTQVPVAGSQSRTALSHPLLASLLPSGLHPTPDTVQRWPRNILSGAPLATSQRVTTVSEPALASWEPRPGDDEGPSGLQATSEREAA